MTHPKVTSETADGMRKLSQWYMLVCEIIKNVVSCYLLVYRMLLYYSCVIRATELREVNEKVPPITLQTKMQLRLRPSRLLQSSVVFPTLRGSLTCQTTLCLRLQRRSITADEKPLPEKGTPEAGPNQEQLPHVSEEAAATGRITGEGGPDIEQGTPVQEVRDTLCIYENHS